MLYFLSFGIVIGLTAGFAPGPLQTLVIAETLRHGTLAGVRVALAPLITDAPIVLASIFLAKLLSNIEPALGLISIFGSAYLLYLSVHSFTMKPTAKLTESIASESLRKGVLANFLSPHPYFFWLGVGAPTLANASKINFLAPLLFIVGFYSCLVGAKILIAILVDHARSAMSNAVQQKITSLLALLLGVFALFLLWEGMQLLGFKWEL